MDNYNDFLKAKNKVKMDMVNALDGASLEIDGLLDGQGFVKVIKITPETHPDGFTPEYLVAKAARVSYNADTKTPVQDKRLIEFLLRNAHTSPLEMCSITFCLKLPIAICRQLLRHRTGKFNEFSQRYSEVTEEVDRFRLDRSHSVLRGADKVNKQASSRNLNSSQIVNTISLINKAEELQDDIFKVYRSLLKAGLAREVARFYLPVSTYTKIYVQFDLNNLIKFFRLRCAPDAQEEIRIYANAMKKLAKQFFPICLNLEDEYTDSIRIGVVEKEMIKTSRIPENVKSKTYIKQLRELAEELNITLFN
jgi:thymidylate synthase (FAD)